MLPTIRLYYMRTRATTKLDMKLEKRTKQNLNANKICRTKTAVSIARRHGSAAEKDERALARLPRVFEGGVEVRGEIGRV